MKNQKEQILAHLKLFGSITSWDAIQKYRITRLAEYIRLLKKDGIMIVSIKEKNEESRWVRYKFCADGQGVLV